MKEILAFACVIGAMCSQALAETTKDVVYYPEDFQVSGDREYANERCKLDVYRPDGLPEGAPAVVWFHGGGLSGGNRHIPSEFVDQKFLVVPVNYRLFPRAKCVEAIEDAAAAVAWTVKSIEKFGGDPKKVTVSGHSAGGYLTAMVGMDPRYLARHGLKNTDLAALYPISGQMTTHFQVVAERETGEKGVANNPLVIDEFAPLFHTTAPISPIHLLVGDPELEWPARVEENALLAAMLRRIKANQVEFHSYPGTNHGSCGPPSRAYIQAELNKMAEAPAKD